MWGRICGHGEGFVKNVKKDLWGGVVTHLEVKRLISSLCKEGFTGKDSCAFKGKKPNSFPLWGRIAVHLKKKQA